MRWIPFTIDRESYFFNAIYSRNINKFQIVTSSENAFFLTYQMNVSHSVVIPAETKEVHSYHVLNTTAKIVNHGEMIESESCLEPIIERVWVWYSTSFIYIWSWHNTSEGSADVALIMGYNDWKPSDD